MVEVVRPSADCRHNTAEALMRSRAVAPLILCTLGLLATPLAAEAQQAGKVWRIGVLSAVASLTSPPFEAFRAGLRELGYVEGQNIVLEFRSAEGRFERVPTLAAELVNLKVDLIFTGGNPAPAAARDATSTIPIVFGVSGDPVAEGLTASLARPGGNITGLASMSPELVTKHLELLKEIVPQAARVAVLQNQTDKAHPLALGQAEGAAWVLGMQLQVLDASSSADIEAAFAAMVREGAQGVLVLRNGLFLTQRTQIVALAAQSRLPTVYGSREEAEAGGLIAYGASIPAMFRQAATYVDKILKGAKPADLPVERPTKFELVINLKTAKELGLTIPPTLLFQADEVIQ